MLRGKVLAIPCRTPASLIRTFTTTTICKEAARSPGLGDVTATGAADFDAKQKEFRRGLADAKRKKEQAERQFRKIQYESNVPPEALRVDSNTAPDTAGGLSQTVLGLGSLSISNSGAGEQRAAEQDTSTKRGGKLTSFIYGTPEGQQLDQDMERSFSQLLARGKYVHTIVFHDVKPDKVDEYVDLVGKWYPKVAQDPKNKVNLVGSWRTEVGDCDTFGWSRRPRTTYLADLE